MSGPATIDLGELQSAASTTPVRKLLALVLLLAIKDKASEVCFDPVPPGHDLDRSASPGRKLAETGEAEDDLTCEAGQVCLLRYEVEGVSYELVPPPVPTSIIAREVMALAGIGPAHRPLWHLGRHLASACGAQLQPVEGQLRLLMGSEAIEVLASVHQLGGSLTDCRVVLRLPDTSRASEAARQALGNSLLPAASSDEP